jgi:hypothetical protein
MDSFLTERLNISDRRCSSIFSAAPDARFQAEENESVKLMY